ncbi:MAG: hypothetical protein ACI4MB_06085 [Candidatus Coproplasma sp.]
MAKRKTTTSTTSNYSIVKVCAFVGLVLAGVAGLVSFILWLLGKIGVTISWGNRVCSICSLLSQIALFITVWLAAWDYVKYKKKAWRIIYIIFLVLGILGLFGIGFF